MRGIVYTGDDVEVTDQLSVGDPGPTEVRVAIGAAGVCHSDLSVINGTIPWKAPSVLGHEGAGVVEAVGSEVQFGQGRGPRGHCHPPELRDTAGPAAPDTPPGA